MIQVRVREEEASDGDVEKKMDQVSVTLRVRRKKDADLTLAYIVEGVLFFEGSSSAGCSSKMFGFRFMMCRRAPCPDPWARKDGSRWAHAHAADATHRLRAQ